MVPIISAAATRMALRIGPALSKKQWAIKTQVHMDKPIHWEMIKLIGNPAPNFMAVKKIAIRVSKTRV